MHEHKCVKNSQSNIPTELFHVNFLYIILSGNKVIKHTLIIRFWYYYINSNCVPFVRQINVVHPTQLKTEQISMSDGISAQRMLTLIQALHDPAKDKRLQTMIDARMGVCILSLLSRSLDLVLTLKFDHPTSQPMFNEISTSNDVVASLVAWLSAVYWQCHVANKRAVTDAHIPGSWGKAGHTVHTNVKEVKLVKVKATHLQKCVYL